MAKYNKTKPLNLAFQQAHIKRFYPHLKCTINRNMLYCLGEIRPTELSLAYTVELTYNLQSSPHVRVLKPPLERNSEGKKPPHLYEGDILCLYHPKFNEWDKSKVIAQTIIPWISLWLYYYEIWLAIGEWKGGGLHPPKKIIDK